jgi:hypothetical protein
MLGLLRRLFRPREWPSSVDEDPPPQAIYVGPAEPLTGAALMADIQRRAEEAVAQAGPPRTCFIKARPINNPACSMNVGESLCGRPPRLVDGGTLDKDLVTCPVCKERMK